MQNFVIILVLFSPVAFASYVVQDGFMGPFKGIDTAALAHEGEDDSFVKLTGKITASMGGERYQFSDATGSIAIEIEHEKWFGLSVTPENVIVIDGKIDKAPSNQVTVDVERIQLAR